MAPRWYDMETAAALAALPGIDRDEAPIVRAWLDAHAGEFDLVAFNVRLGDGRPGFGDDSPAAIAAWKGMTQLRADVVAQTRRGFVVVEAKAHARIDAVTQLARYTTLLPRESWSYGRVDSRLIARSVDRGVVAALEARGFAFEQFEGVA